MIRQDTDTLIGLKLNSRVSTRATNVARLAKERKGFFHHHLLSTVPEAMMEMATNPAHHMVQHLAQASAAVARRSIPKVRADVVRTAGRSDTSRQTKSQYNPALLLPLSMFLELDKVILRSRAGFATCARRWSLSASGSRAWTSSQSHQGVVELDDHPISKTRSVSINSTTPHEYSFVSCFAVFVPSRTHR